MGCRYVAVVAVAVFSLWARPGAEAGTFGGGPALFTEDGETNTGWYVEIARSKAQITPNGRVFLGDITIAGSSDGDTFSLYLGPHFAYGVASDTGTFVAGAIGLGFHTPFHPSADIGVMVGKLSDEGGGLCLRVSRDFSYDRADFYVLSVQIRI